MENKPAPWPEHFGLTSCAASVIDPAIPEKDWGVAVIYAPAADRETVFLVLESRAGSLRELCAKRLGTAKLHGKNHALGSFVSHGERIEVIDHVSVLNWL